MLESPRDLAGAMQVQSLDSLSRGTTVAWQPIVVEIPIKASVSSPVV